MRVMRIATAIALALTLAACSFPSSETAPVVPERPWTAAPSTSAPFAAEWWTSDALLLAAARASSAKPVRIVGYELVLWEKGQMDFEVFMTKSGELLQPRKWGAGPGFPDLDERPPARITPESGPERQAQQSAIAKALALSASRGWGSDEAMVRIYLLQDAAGVQYLMTPDGVVRRKAPPLFSWGEGSFDPLAR